MGTGPIPASRKALEKAGWKVGDLDLVEANEAFAAQALAVNKDMGWDPERVNVNGGAIAIGHPIGASGARVLTTLLHEMKRRDAKKGLATLVHRRRHGRRDVRGALSAAANSSSRPSAQRESRDRSPDRARVGKDANAQSGRLSASLGRDDETSQEPTEEPPTWHASHWSPAEPAASGPRSRRR